MKKSSAKKTAPSGPNIMISLRISPAIHEQAQALAEKKGMKLSAIIQIALAEYIEREPKG